ncbi:MAG: nucleotidyltransferase domain-containing protein [Candidatus Nanoarchaeia archaeon]
MGLKLTAYAMDVASFLIQKMKDKKVIKNIILFGSVAREESGKESDIDVFVDVFEENKAVEKEIKKMLEEFYLSVKYKNYWKLLGMENEIQLIVGKLDDWKELKPSIVANGITLYGKFKSSVEGIHKCFFIWENIQPNAKRVLFNKQMFGYKQGGKQYSGILQKIQGERMGKGCVLVPLEASTTIHNLFKKHKITVKIKKVIDYS